MLKNTIDPKTAHVGDIVRYNPDNFTWNPGLRGDVDYEIIDVLPRRTDGAVYLNVQEVETGHRRNGYGYEWFSPTDRSQLSRPTVDFSQGRYATARRYASDLYSPKHLGPTATAVLARVIDSEKVDAYELAEAVLYAARSAANRGRNAADRNSLATKAGHLGHIAHATLQNHADRLPAYEQGVRSRKIETLEGELEALQTAAHSVMDELNAVTTDLRATKDAAAEYRERADAEVTRLLELASVRDTLLAETVTERDELVETNVNLTASLEYALGLLATLDRGAAYQTLGFMDAHGIEIHDA